MAGKVDKLMGGVYREDDGKGAVTYKYLLIDQTTPQTVVNGAPQFDEGVVIKANQKVYLDGL